MPALYGIIGYPLTHSFSPAYFTEKFKRENIDAVYEKFELKNISEFPALLISRPAIKGLNVTIPYKKEIITYLDVLDEFAKNIGAVNCIAIKKGKLIGYNTDATGFEKSLIPLLKPLHKKALVLGTGGSSLAVKYVLAKLGIEYLPVSRKNDKGQITYDELNDEIIKNHLLIINTTPLGMYPSVNVFPTIPYEFLVKDHLLYDLIYNPVETKFLSKGKCIGATTKNGLEMLHLQAEENWKIWSESEIK